MGNSKHEAVESSFAWNKCKKNPGHHQFIPATEFSLSDLPQWCRKPLILDYVKFQCAMTVKLRVKYNSWGRPNGYCFSNFRGTSLAHFGSGLFLGMSYESGPCQCYDCEHSLSPHQTFYKLEVITARHVIYNSEEAKATQVSFFYDDEASSTDGRMKTAWGNTVTDISDEGDRCILQCLTHDETLVRQLKHINAQYKHLVFKFEGQVGASPNMRWKNLCLVVAHPHGQPKKVTLGEMKSCTSAGRLHQKQFTYSTDTCPGSSGAFMLLLEFYEAIRYISWHTGMMWGAVHSLGGLEGGYNKSGFSNPDVEDWCTPISVRFPRSLLWLASGTWLSNMWHR